VEPGARASAVDRAFALTSVVPLGAFLCFHLVDYARVLFGATELGAKHAPSHVVLGLELVVVWLPLALHALFGVVVWLQRRKFAETTPSRKALVSVHRLAGGLLVPFLVDHFVRFRLPILRGERFASDSVQVLAAELSRTDGGGLPWLAAATLLGTASAAFHLGYGLARIAERTPGLRGPIARRAGFGIGLAVGVTGIFSVLRLATG